MNIHPYLCYEGRCEEALDFYREAIGAEVTYMMRFNEMPGDSECAPGLEDKIMHAAVKVGDGFFMASDGQAKGEMNFAGITLSLQVGDKAEAEAVFARLSEGGEVTMPLHEMFWSPAFGMLLDRFGVAWMVNVIDPTTGKND